jgi:hypothetical protein
MRAIVLGLLLVPCAAVSVLAAGRCEYEAALSDPAELVLRVAARCAGVSAPGFSACCQSWSGAGAIAGRG